MSNDEKFLQLCLKYQEQISSIILSGVFETKGAKIILNFNSNGVLQEIRKSDERLWIRQSLTIKNKIL